MSVLNNVRSHPRLFLPDETLDAMRERIETDALLGAYAGRMLSEADGMLDLDPVQRRKIGRRMLGISRTCLRRVLTLSLAHRLTGRADYADRAEREMLSAAGFRDWNPSHFLDVAEMTAALAIGYDWLYESLPDSSRDAIRRAIVEKGLRPSLAHNAWAGSTHNWNPVCNGSLTLGALAVLEEETDLATQIIERAVRTVPLAMNAYGPNGAYPEGPGYWRYGTAFNVLMIDALESALGTDMGLGDHESFMASPDYYLHAHGSTGDYFNYSDCGRGAGLAPAMFWFARRLDRPELLWMESRKLADLLELPTDPNDARTNHGGRLLPMMLIWSPPLNEISPPARLSYRDDGHNPVTIHRTGWEPDDVYFGLKAGSPAQNHGHMDVGSFVLEADGVRWAVDPGSEGYHGLESKGVDLWNMSQESERWDVFRLGNQGHGTLVVDGRRQRVEGKATIERFSSEQPGSVIDMTAVYAGQLAEARRGIALREGPEVTVEDELRAPDRDVSVRWAMVTEARVQIDGHRARLRQDGQSLLVEVLAPDAARLELAPMRPETQYESQNAGMRMLAFTVEVPAGQRMDLRVSFVPGIPEVLDEISRPKG